MKYIGKEVRKTPLIVTGSTLTVDLGAASASAAITTNNITNGYPTSNNWGESLDGSYFNNFTHETNVSEILRFIAGAMSHSLDVSDASPNTKFIDSVDTNETSLGSTATSSPLGVKTLPTNLSSESFSVDSFSLGLFSVESLSSLFNDSSLALEIIL